MGFLAARTVCGYDLLDVAFPKPVLVAVFHESARGVDHEYAFTSLRLGLRNHHHAGGDACSEKDVGRERDDPLYETFVDQRLAYRGLGIAS